MEIGKRNGIVPDIELGNVEDTDIGKDRYDVIIASSVFEHVEYWRRGLEKVYTALKPNGALFFESTNKYMLRILGHGVPEIAVLRLAAGLGALWSAPGACMATES